MSYISDLRDTVQRAAPALLALPAEAAARRPAPGKWSPKEIIGHLIDSASNNHGRFVRAQFEDHLEFAGYDQERWVAAQRYQDADWPELVALWRQFNLRLAQVMASIPAEVRGRERARHNLQERAFRPLPPGNPATLDFLMEDYVEHLKHHLAQIPLPRQA